MVSLQVYKFIAFFFLKSKKKMKRVARFNYKIFKYSTSKKWGIFSDIHFQDNNLSRINETTEWILDEFKKSK